MSPFHFQSLESHNRFSHSFIPASCFTQIFLPFLSLIYSCFFFHSFIPAFCFTQIFLPFLSLIIPVSCFTKIFLPFLSLICSCIFFHLFIPSPRTQSCLFCHSLNPGSPCPFFIYLTLPILLLIQPAISFTPFNPASP